MRKPMSALAAVLVLTACASGSPRAGSRLDANTITREQIEQEGPSNCYDLVQKLRPNWLRWRGSTSFKLETDVIVYVDGTRLGESEELRNINTADVQKLEYLDARAATVRYGSGHVQGAILVTTRR